ncbi:basic blue protein-like [Quercus lobata]|uniref:basic blue protein-like n=1 Tax=Quercus lobata TaxID=97700 RepID=UPI001248D167|nr:basic blue protein-like [Quercus lobata]
MAKEAAFLFITLLALRFYQETALAETKTFLVGGLKGWTKENIGNWFPIGTIFYAGDKLEFEYNPTEYNVVCVDKHAYETCKAPEGALEYNKGNDQIYLEEGENYFICTTRGCCENNMKMMVVTAAGQRPTDREEMGQVRSGQDNQVRSWVRLIGIYHMFFFLFLIT